MRPTDSTFNAGLLLPGSKDETNVTMERMNINQNVSSNQNVKAHPFAQVFLAKDILKCLVFLVLHCKYLRSDYDQIAVIHRVSTIIGSALPLVGL